jgi:gas vesicle protein
MALKHDAQGFLVGDPIDLGRLVEEWAAIKDDVRAIRRAIVGGGQANISGQASSRVVPIAAVPRAVAGRQRLAAPLEPAIPNSGFSGAARRESDGAVIAMRQAAAALRATQAATLRAPAEPARRDSRGRFVAGQTANQKKPGKRPGDDPRDNEEREEGLIRSISERVGGAFKEASTGLEEADPAVKAISEIAQPVARGFELMSGGDPQKKQERWLRRIFTTLTGSRKEQGLFNKIAAKRLKAIEEKPDEKSGEGGLFGGLLGLLGGLLMKIPIIGGLLSAGGAAADGLGKLLLGGGKGLLRKIPILGGLLASLGAASDIYSTETDDTLTRGEKDKRTGKAAGGLAGTLGGLWAGAKLGAAVGALGGPIGAAIGGVVGGAAGMFFGDKAGQVLGETVGGWVSDLRNADIPGMISNAWATTTGTISSAWSAATAAIVSAWDSTTSAISSVWGSAVDGVQKGWDSVVAGFSAVGDSIGKKWEGFVDAAKSGWDSITSLFSSAYEGLKSLPGIGPAIEAVEGAAQKASEVVSNVVSGAKDLASSAVDKAVELGGQAAEKVQAVAQKTAEAASAVKNAVQDSTVGRGATKAWEGAAWVGDRATAAKDWVLGKTSKLFESGSGGAGTVSTGRGDHGGASYGTYQLASNTGTLKKFLDSTSYGEQFKGMTPGTREFNDKWKQIARDDPNFGDAQHEFIKQTHFDPQIERLNKAGIDLSGRGAAVKDSVWSTSVQFGGNSSLIEKALAGRDVEKMSDSEIVSTIQDYKIQNNDRLFASSSDAVRRGTLNRAHQEKERLLELAQADIQARPDERSTLAAPPAAPAAPVVASATMPEAISLAAPAAPVVAVASVPAVPSAPAMPPIADAPTVSVPMASNDSRKPMAVVSAPTEVGQDLRERGIAHIATGGLSA